MAQATTNATASPQLVMQRSLSELPPLCVCPPYLLRWYRAGDEAAWDQIIGVSFGWEESQGKFVEMIHSSPQFQAQRVYFIVRQGMGAVATATAWFHPQLGPSIGYLHMVGALPSEAGQGLGLRVSLACLYRLRDEGRALARLRTDDFRLAAIKTYLRLGFAPLLIHENQRERWRDIFLELEQPELLETFAQILGGPIVTGEA